MEKKRERRQEKRESKRGQGTGHRGQGKGEGNGREEDKRGKRKEKRGKRTREKLPGSVLLCLTTGTAVPGWFLRVWHFAIIPPFITFCIPQF